MTQVFISYRRSDSAAGYGRMLSDALRRRLGPREVFRDVRSITAGAEFPATIRKALAECRVCLVLIGTRWLEAGGQEGGRRIDSPDDWVRQEVGTALATPGVRVVPVLIGGALPAAADLPPDLRPLLQRNAYELRDKHFERDLDAMIDELVADGVLTPRPGGWRRRAPLIAAAAGLVALGGAYALFWPALSCAFADPPPANVEYFVTEGPWRLAAAPGGEMDLGPLRCARAADVRIARNEIYARAGRIFSDEALNAHFGQFAWYRDQPDKARDRAVTGARLANAKTLQALEERKLADEAE